MRTRLHRLAIDSSLDAVSAPRIFTYISRASQLSYQILFSATGYYLDTHPSARIPFSNYTAKREELIENERYSHSEHISKRFVSYMRVFCRIDEGDCMYVCVFVYMCVSERCISRSLLSTRIVRTISLA